MTILESLPNYEKARAAAEARGVDLLSLIETFLAEYAEKPMPEEQAYEKGLAASRSLH